jgi:hypothetical protein
VTADVSLTIVFDTFLTYEKLEAAGSLTFALISTATHCLSLAFPETDQPSSQRSYFFLTCDMADQSGSAHFQALFEAALLAYEKKPGVKLAKHPLAITTPELPLHRRRHYPSTGMAQAFNYFQGSDRTLTSIKTIVSI